MFPPLLVRKEGKVQAGLFEKEESGYIQHDSIPDFILDQAHIRYGLRVAKEDIFYFGLFPGPAANWLNYT